MAFLTGFLYQYPVLYYLHFALQIAFIIHALTHRRQIFWVFLIFFIPVIGVLAYFFLEILPGLRVRRVNFEPVIEGLRSQESRIKTRREALAELDTLQNRVALAGELARAQRYGEAEEILAPARVGIYKDDPSLLYQLADLAYRQEKYQEARSLLEQIDSMRSQALQSKAKVLLADTLVRLGDHERAERYYQEAMNTATSEEPRVKYAQFLLQRDRREEAQVLLAQVEKTQRRANNLYRTQEREWFRLAEQLRQNLK
ncbi:PLDc N-terminal domain-containing protein [Deinococcus peraridilitoris]|uniref:Uncharacterized protein n=1 Tax=Deinococcus peraridilitoris (strain DSM 19664 / LMG 22246 / CIP 109416 / KR-200) TaxID=937777 RepID=L0A045_DEIPD|nr:PLDc N-terminal domain-containing protein [Deinococcus peraridilitoris]AFZ66547.1 hypothetical protein Deipe_0983 [Deinococcus peraridilitoris DSM 19664]